MVHFSKKSKALLDYNLQQYLQNSTQEMDQDIAHIYETKFINPTRNFQVRFYLLSKKITCYYWFMIIIKCAKCKRKVLKYRKVGSGRILKCFKSRITRYYQVSSSADLLCSCGKLIGNDEGSYYRMKQGTFIYTGMVIK